PLCPSPTLFRSVRAQVRDDILMGDDEQAIDDRLVPLAGSMLASLDALGEALEQRSAQAQLALRQSVRQALVLLAAICIAAIAIGAFIAWRTSRSLTVPTADAVRIAESIAEGDLPQSCRAGRDDEI